MYGPFHRSDHPKSLPMVPVPSLQSLMGHEPSLLAPSHPLFLWLGFSFAFVTAQQILLNTRSSEHARRAGKNHCGHKRHRGEVGLVADDSLVVP